MRPYETFITDFDGTLCDTLEANIAAYGQAFTDVGEKFDPDLYRQNFGLRFDAMMQAIAPNLTDIQKAAIVERKAVHYAEQVGLVTVNRLLVSLLRHTKDSGGRVGLATTAKERNVRAVLDHFGLTDLFEAFVFGEDVHHGKPDPECYELLIRKLNAKPDTTLIFEDSPVGIEAAERAGAHVLKVAL